MFSHKVVIVTGASSGIGADTAILFAKESANVVLVGRDANKLNFVSNKCKEIGSGDILEIQADITNDDDINKIVDETVDRFGQIDILINNAGIGMPGGIYDGIEVFDKTIATNVRALYALTCKAVPFIVKTKGNIVNVSSATSLKCVKHVKVLAYSMGKAAVNHFTKCLALELSTDGVRVNAVCPGITKTPFFEAMGLKGTDVDRLLSDVPTALGKVAESVEIAELIIFLASDKARSVTGSIYVADNGELLL